MVEFFKNLSNDYLELLIDNEDFNVIIKVNEPTSNKIFKVRSAILRKRSLYFRNELTNINSDTNNIKTINLNHVSVEQFEIIIKLQNWCNDIIVKYPEKVFDSEDFYSIPENALISLIESDDLKMDEINIWNYIIKWRIAKNPGLSSNLKEWSLKIL
ncbi:hypothetical protein C2G38_2241449 [Gigaspora rosea]|uniref:BTB domain-containing protein n=1 Tax=Gigaspora rosea TaxID=44941 RepID=A0A397VS33_9GLOM|nr:hypothetical protein C2G38_2241449 [Gigaspora rosea]